VKREVRAERLTRRIESFSDLVIGFSLALLALTLSIPPHIIDLLRNPWWLIAYFWTFAVIARIWYTHQRLFTRLFWPDPLSVVLNFVLLAMVGLLVYFVQVFVHYRDDFERVWAFIAYFAVLGVLLTIVGVLHWRGAHHRWKSLDAEDRYFAVQQALRNGVAGVCVFIGAVVNALLRPHDFNDIWLVPIAVVIGLTGTRIAVRALKPRIMRASDGSLV
jgi:uncharacterized membrane protein